MSESNTGRKTSNPPRPSGALASQLSSSPRSFSSRSYGATDSRSDATARLATPVPGSYLGSTPPRGRPINQGEETGSRRNSPLPGASQKVQGPGISALAAALAVPETSSTPRLGTPPVRTASPAASASQGPDVQTNYGSFDAMSRTAQSGGAYEDPEIIKRHLVRPNDASETASTNGDVAKAKQGEEPADDDDEFSSLRLQGGDITRQIYRWTEEADSRNRMQRSKSFSATRDEPENEVLDINSIRAPGGFRRNYLRRTARSPSANPQHLESGANAPSPGNGPQPQLFTNSFLEFLTLYGHFAGEELEEDDEDLLPGEYFGSSTDDSDAYESDDSREPMEDSALLTPSRRKRRRKPRRTSGNNSPINSALLLLKSFVGTGVLFLPRAYLNGGMVFANLILLAVAALSYYCFVLLVSTRLKVEGSFGDLGGILYGKWLRNVILTSIVISQIGFVAAYIVFTAANLQAFILAVSNCTTYIGVPWLILLQMIIFLPFSLFRDIGKLGFTALIADAFIVLGLAYLFYFDVFTLSTKGLADIIYFNNKEWPLFIGTAIFTFEGIGLIIPIQESMKTPSKFPKVMFYVMIIITVIFITMGGVSYAAYGSHTETVVLLNLPQDSKLVNGVQLLYSLAILLSTPLQIFPAIKITENALFTRSGKYNPYIKWQKNIYRFGVVFLCALIAWGGADDLDKFVALVGNFACIPLVFIYPPMLHYKAVARSRLWKASDIALGIFGVFAMIYTTSLTVISWANGKTGPPLPKYCDTHGL
ncbi:transmembrane amino acid transporter protein-domain-containing protein [Microdochium bolleyi]|uniref:Transmembrane amino acid transporter protein-domain-containing protein n=1 Tax=Microdochium bolleyi TaxID=196109 RepID=A0A136J6Q8_9PEZI|nr:transmembrane amino acid transporter protein-domain-containing protein [Microdochium bolleyi]